MEVGRRMKFHPTGSHLMFVEAVVAIEHGIRENEEFSMNKDRAKGKMKDVSGRVERQTGEWAGDPKRQGHGALKQAEGKLQSTVGKLKDSSKRSQRKRAA